MKTVSKGRAQFADVQACGVKLDENSPITCELEEDHEDVWHQRGKVYWNYDGSKPSPRSPQILELDK